MFLFSEVLVDFFFVSFACEEEGKGRVDVHVCLYVSVSVTLSLCVASLDGCCPRLELLPLPPCAARADTLFFFLAVFDASCRDIPVMEISRGRQCKKEASKIHKATRASCECRIHSSVVEHSAAVRMVPGSNPGGSSLFRRHHHRQGENPQTAAGPQTPSRGGEKESLR
jgi:hypothetical protein